MARWGYPSEAVANGVHRGVAPRNTNRYRTAIPVIQAASRLHIGSPFWSPCPLTCRGSAVRLQQWGRESSFGDGWCFG